jgi:hypothetical protein
MEENELLPPGRGDRIGGDFKIMKFPPILFRLRDPQVLLRRHNHSFFLPYGSFRPVFSSLGSLLLPVHTHEANLDHPCFRGVAYADRSHGFCIGHITPEAQVGGPIALVKDGDVIHVDAVKNTIELRVPDEELEKRRKEWKPHPLKVNQGTLYKYVKMVSDASRGCITDA